MHFISTRVKIDSKNVWDKLIKVYEFKFINMKGLEPEANKINGYGR